jgi:hypothetical protein
LKEDRFDCFVPEDFFSLPINQDDTPSSCDFYIFAFENIKKAINTKRCAEDAADIFPGTWSQGD